MFTKKGYLFLCLLCASGVVCAMQPNGLAPKPGIGVPSELGQILARRRALVERTEKEVEASGIVTDKLRAARERAKKEEKARYELEGRSVQALRAWRESGDFSPERVARMERDAKETGAMIQGAERSLARRKIEVQSLLAGERAVLQYIKDVSERAGFSQTFIAQKVARGNGRAVRFFQVKLVNKVVGLIPTYLFQE